MKQLLLLQQGTVTEYAQDVLLHHRAVTTAGAIHLGPQTVTLHGKIKVLKFNVNQADISVLSRI